MEQVIAYCERTDFGLWSEPVNALSNGAFLMAAVWAWPMTRGLPLARAMAVMLAVIGLGSFLWHIHATRWAGLADVLPIFGFILLYLFAATRDYLGASGVLAGAVAAAFLPYMLAFAWGLGMFVPGIGANAAYLSVAVLIVVFGLYLRRTATGQGLLVGAVILCISLGFRMLDGPVCDVFPLGTHFLWHILNAVMLGWMIRVYCHHMQRI